MGNILAMKVEGGAYVLGAGAQNPQSSEFFLLHMSLFFPWHRFDKDIGADENYYHYYCHPTQVIQGCLGHLWECEGTHPSY